MFKEKSFSIQQTTYRIGNRVYYWVLYVWLRPDPVIVKEDMHAHTMSSPPPHTQNEYIQYY